MPSTTNNAAGFFIAYNDISLLDGIHTPFVDYNSALGQVSPTDLGIKAARAHPYEDAICNAISRLVGHKIRHSEDAIPEMPVAKEARSAVN
jgi:hypothetical protein